LLELRPPFIGAELGRFVVQFLRRVEVCHLLREH
jgi:hypothetical protein